MPNELEAVREFLCKSLRVITSKMIALQVAAIRSSTDAGNVLTAILDSFRNTPPTLGLPIFDHPGKLGILAG